MNKHFKAQFLEAGRREAFRMHRVGLRNLLFIEKISKDLKAQFRPTPEEIDTTVSYHHLEAVIDSYSVSVNVHDIAQTRIFPLPLYRRLIRHTATQVFSDFCRRFHFSRFLESANRINLFFSVYSQLHQAQICLPEEWALATRASITHLDPPHCGISDLIKTIGTEFLYCYRNNALLNPIRIDEHLECVIKITEQNPCARERGQIQTELAELCAKQAKIEIARTLLANVQDCHHTHDYGVAVITLIKHASPDASLVTEAEAYLKRDFLTVDEQVFYLRRITVILKSKSPSLKDI